MRLCEQNPGTMCDNCREKYVVMFTRAERGEDEEFVCCDTYEEASEIRRKLDRTAQFCGIPVKRNTVVLLIPRDHTDEIRESERGLHHEKK